MRPKHRLPNQVNCAEQCLGTLAALGLSWDDAVTNWVGPKSKHALLLHIPSGNRFDFRWDASSRFKGLELASQIAYGSLGRVSVFSVGSDR